MAKKKNAKKETKSKAIESKPSDDNDMLTGAAVGMIAGGAQGALFGAAMGGLTGGIVGGMIGDMFDGD